jgi:hypothetical protein
MTENFLTFKRFSNEEDAKDLIELLKAQNISYSVEDASPQFDVTFANNNFEKEVHIKLKPEDFERTEEILRTKDSQLTTEDIPPDYYLLEFSNEELIEILMKPDEWSSIDYNLSQRILESRGKSIDQEFLDTLRKKRTEELSKPEQTQKNWIYAGYIFALLGGLLGVFIGWHLLTFKKTLPTGERAYGYVESDRRNGRNILIIGLIFVAIEIVFWLNENGF